MELNKLGKYTLLEKLGEGATAEVYLARDTALGREVALKILRPALVADPIFNPVDGQMGMAPGNNTIMKHNHTCRQMKHALSIR